MWVCPSKILAILASHMTRKTRDARAHLRVTCLFQYATWDLAFHMIPFIDLDLEFAKKQLLLFLSDRYMHSSGQVSVRPDVCCAHDTLRPVLSVGADSIQR